MQKKTVKGTNNKRSEEIVYDEVISEQNTEMDEEDRGKGIHAQDPYQYFDFKRIKKSLEIPEKSRRRAAQILKNRSLAVEDVSEGFVGAFHDVPACFVTLKGEETAYRRRSPVTVKLLMDKNTVLQADCSCKECQDAHFYWSQQSNCGYIAAALELAQRYLADHNEMDATDRIATSLIRNFAVKKRSQIISENRGQEKSVVLEPRIVYKDEELGLAFKVGDDRLFVVKDLSHFADLVKNSSTETYGSSKVINHGIQNFTPEVREMGQFYFGLCCGGTACYECRRGKYLEESQ